jgi:hypothetical protein
MKKSRELFVFGLLFIASILGASGNSSTIEKAVAVAPEDAIVCTVRDSEGGLIGRCYFCNCADFADAFCTCAGYN